jgi:rhodanese-related sulfurtransferase
VTSEQPVKKKTLYLRPLPLLLGAVLIVGAGMQGIAKVNGLTIKDHPYVVFLSYKTPLVTLADLEQQKIKPAIFVDVRTPDEYKQDHIANSPLIPLYEIEEGPGIQKIQDLAKAASQPNQPAPTIVLYCAGGPRSIKAYHKLKESGVQLNMVVLKSGFREWRQAVAPNQDLKILAPIAPPPPGSKKSHLSHTAASK